MAKPEVVEGVVKINVPIDYEELERQMNKNVPRIIKEVKARDVIGVNTDGEAVIFTREQPQEIFKQPITITYPNKEDLILANLIRIEEKLDRLLERMGDAETTNSL